MLLFLQLDIFLSSKLSLFLSLSCIPSAQGISGGLMSLFFLFGGLFVPLSGLPVPWHFAYYIDPVT
jgi:hypothetical protein